MRWLEQQSAYCGQRTRQCVCRNRNVLGYVLFARGGSNFPMVTEGLHFPTKVSGSILCLWLHHNCINKDWSSRGQRLQLEAVSEASLLSTVLPCKQTGSVWIHWCHSLLLNIQLLLCFLHLAGLYGCKWVLWVLMWKLGLLLPACSVGEVTWEPSSGQQWELGGLGPSTVFYQEGGLWSPRDAVLVQFLAALNLNICHGQE